MKTLMIYGLGIALSIIGAGCACKCKNTNHSFRSTLVEEYMNEKNTIPENTPYVFRHEGYPETYHLRKLERPKKVVPKDISPEFNRHICPDCKKEFIPPYHINHKSICKGKVKEERI